MGRANFGFLDVQYLQNIVFGIEIGLNGRNHSSADFHHPTLTKISYRIPHPVR